MDLSAKIYTAPLYSIPSRVIVLAYYVFTGLSAKLLSILSALDTLHCTIVRSIAMPTCLIPVENFHSIAPSDLELLN